MPREGRPARRLARGRGLPGQRHQRVILLRKRRDDFARLVEAIKAGRINAVIAGDSDRMFRQPSEHEPYMKLCQQFGVQNGAVRVEISTTTPR